jgi:hypothetical protein
MNYLELVNGVLMRLREQEIPTVRVHEDPVANLAKMFVNDAKRYVEAAHGWNATRYLWEFDTEVDTPAYVLEKTSNGARITGVQIDGGYLNQWDLSALMLGSPRSGKPYRWAFQGTDDDGNLMMRFDNIPDAVWPISVLGWRQLPDLYNDMDKLAIPDQPVLYYALALAARERGEVGGQTAQELFAMAQQYISDAIALDANLSPTEYTWAVV